MRTKGHSERMLHKAQTYKGFKDKAHQMGTEMGRALGLSHDIINEALALYDEVWKKAPRTPQGTMVDCIYHTANKHGAKTSTRAFSQKLRECYGVGTEPKTGWMHCI